MASAATWTYLAGWSPAATTNVRWRVTAAFDDATVKRGTQVTLRGSVGPVRSGTRVVVQRLSGTWTTVGTRAVSVKGSYAFAFTPSAAGTYTYRVRVETTPLNTAGATGNRVLTVS